jgi:hypothetical protein
MIKTKVQKQIEYEFMLKNLASNLLTIDIFTKEVMQ